MATKRVQIDEDLLKHPLTIDKAEQVMELRREHVKLRKKLQAMTVSFTKRTKPHNDRIDEITKEIAAILEPKD